MLRLKFLGNYRFDPSSQFQSHWVNIIRYIDTHIDITLVYIRICTRDIRSHTIRYALFTYSTGHRRVPHHVEHRGTPLVIYIYSLDTPGPGCYCILQETELNGKFSSRAFTIIHTIFGVDCLPSFAMPCLCVCVCHKQVAFSLYLIR